MTLPSPLPSSCPPHPWSCKQHRLSDPCPHLHKHLEQPARGREVKNSQVCELQKHMKCSTSTVLKFLRVANQLRLFIHLYVEQKTLWSTKIVFFLDKPSPKNDRPQIYHQKSHVPSWYPTWAILCQQYHTAILTCSNWSPVAVAGFAHVIPQSLIQLLRDEGRKNWWPFHMEKKNSGWKGKKKRKQQIS